MSLHLLENVFLWVNFYFEAKYLLEPPFESSKITRTLNKRRSFLGARHYFGQETSVQYPGRRNRLKSVNRLNHILVIMWQTLLGGAYTT